MNKIYLFILVAATLTLGSCKTALKAYEKGNYEDAVELAVRQLQKKGYNEDTKNLLKNAYSFAVNEHEDKIRTLSAYNSSSHYEKIYHEYLELKKISEAINNSAEARKVLKAIDYSSYVQTYRDKTGDVYFEQGLALMDASDKRSYREAYRMFNTAAKYKNNAAIQQKIKEAYDAAVVTVMIVPVDAAGSIYHKGYNNRSYYNNNYNKMYGFGYRLRNFHEHLARNLQYRQGNEFVEFVTELDAADNFVKVDEILEIGLRDIDVGRYFDNNYKRNVSKQILVKEIIYKPDSVVKQYATVHASINATQRTYISKAELMITARDTKGNYLWSDIIKGDHRWTTEFATYNGDERALSPNDRNLLNNSNYSHPFGNMSEDDIINKLLQQIENEAFHRFGTYYSQF